MRLGDLFRFLRQSTQQQEHRSLLPLTADTAKALGHVAWVEEQDPVIAYAKMYESLQTSAYNCAVWANAGDRIDPARLSLLKNWRQNYALAAGIERKKFGRRIVFNDNTKKI